MSAPCAGHHVSRVTRPGHLALRTPGRLHAPPLYSAHFWSDPFHLCGGFTGLHSAQVAPSNSSLPLKLKQFFLTRHEAGLRRISQITDRTQTSVSKYFLQAEKILLFVDLFMRILHKFVPEQPPATSLLPPGSDHSCHSWSQLARCGARCGDVHWATVSHRLVGKSNSRCQKPGCTAHTALHTGYWILARAECGDGLMLAADFLLLHLIICSCLLPPLFHSRSSSSASTSNAHIPGNRIRCIVV